MIKKKEPKWRHKSIREFKLDDGTLWTVETMMEKTGWARGTCYARLINSTDPEYIFRVLGKTQTGKTYTLDDGSVWTGDQLAEFLQCKRSTAGTRLAMMKGDSKRILKPVQNPIKDSEMYKNDKEVQEYVESRMFWDKQGHWALINKNT